MFTEGLDERSISWIKQGPNGEQASVIRSPLSEKMSPIPRSPLSGGYGGSNYTSSPVLPPLKFHSGLLDPRNIVPLNLDRYGDESDEDSLDDESVASVPDNFSGNYSEDDCLRFSDSNYQEQQPAEDFYKKEILRGPDVSCLNRGPLKGDLKIEVPENYRRFTTDGGLGFGKFQGQNRETATSCRLPRIILLNTNETPKANYRTVVDMGTPSAPPAAVESENVSDDFPSSERVTVEDNPDIQKETGDGIYVNNNHSSNWQSQSSKEDDHLGVRMEQEAVTADTQPPELYTSPYYNTSGQNAWQTLIAYDGCVRLCLNAWARGCTEAPEFLRDECLVLRSAFGLHKFLLQPRGLQPIEKTGIERVEQVCSQKVKKVVGKMRVEVRKLRLVPRRSLKSTYSQRSAIYLKVGAQYVKHVSSIVKTGINSLGIVSYSPSEEKFSCLFHLKSSTEETELESGSAISLRAGTGDYYDFFPQSQGDALLLEVYDSKKVIQGRAFIPVSSLSDNSNDKTQWWPIYHDDHECVGKIQLSIGIAITSDETSQIKSAPIVETLAYDLLLEAAMRALKFHSRNLRLDGVWKWLLTEFSDYYGVSDSYAQLRYLSYVMNVATPTKDCLEIVYELLVPVIEARSRKNLTRQEKSILLGCETQIDSLLATVFENYKSLDENSPTGLVDIFAPIPEVAAPALTPAVQIYTLLHDILAQDVQTSLRNYLERAAAKTCRKHMVETDEFVSSSNTEGFFMDPITISTAYLKMKNLCINISNEIRADIKIHNEHVLPSSIDLSNITASVYGNELFKRLKAFLSTWPPSGPMAHVNELLVATADFERKLEAWNISPAQCGVDSRNVYHNYIMVWVQDMQLHLLDLCKAEKVPWSGVTTNYSTSPFAEEMYDKIKEILSPYEVVMNRWPQYSLVLENAVANIERAIIKALEKQYTDILTPLKDSIPKKLGMQVQKFTRRQSIVLYSVPNQLGIFMNTIKRVLDVLHCKIEDILRAWASYLPVNGDKKQLFGEQMNGITVLLRTKYKNYMQATVVKLINNLQDNKNTRLKKILEETKESDGEAELRERMQMLTLQLIDSISNLHEVFTSRIFIATCRGFWDRMGQIVLKFLVGRKENRVWYNGSYYALGILDDTFASQMQRLQGNALQEKDLEPPRSIVEARSILCRDTTNTTDAYF
ncbi:uncharacterized protein LOC124937465 [Impatiens glandulifera]|uniref:uncharacterized protein LOC124937465 n=1 Tax=Impatiens glandulifera TaxID=253017 RepID=UPI001FB1A1FF|nr:uncharacterized protein LOC124937465 [Impatiens glandulifera]